MIIYPDKSSFHMKKKWDGIQMKFGASDFLTHFIPSLL